MSKSFALPLWAGLAIIVLTLIVVGIVNLPKAEGADAAKLRGTGECHRVQVALDQGYGITRKVDRNICD